jgi:hypothetical protein
VLPQRYGQNDKDWAQHQNEKREFEVIKEEKKGEKEERKRRENCILLNCYYILLVSWYNMATLSVHVGREMTCGDEIPWGSMT